MGRNQIVSEKTAVFGNFSHPEEDGNFSQQSHSSDDPKETSSGSGSNDVMLNTLTDNPNPKFGSIEFRVSDHVPLWKAALASSAVPFYFPAINIDDEMYADGGMDANCPVEAALAAAEYQFPNRSVEILLSLGAGTATSK